MAYNFSHFSSTCQKLLKLMEICQSSDRNNCAQFFLRHGVYIVYNVLSDCRYYDNVSLPLFFFEIAYLCLHTMYVRLPFVCFYVTMLLLAELLMSEKRRQTDRHTSRQADRERLISPLHVSLAPHSLHIIGRLPFTSFVTS